MQHFLLIKRDALTRAGLPIDAARSALLLLDARIWPLWRGTRNRARVVAGDEVAVYLAGAKEGRVIAHASVESVRPWTRELARAYPLSLDAEPVCVLHLAAAQILQHGVDVRSLLPRLSFVRPGIKKWGVYFMGGMRAVPADDFALLTH